MVLSPVYRFLRSWGRGTETERDREHGRAVWEADLTRQHQEWEVTIDAVTGKVISARLDSGTEHDH